MDINFKPSDTMYKCKKIVVLQNYKESICKWSGTLYDYIHHVRQKHKDNYFLMEKPVEKFQWKLPYLGNQLDIGIFKHKLGHFLYEIIYKKDEGNLYFALSCIENFVINENYTYVLILQNEQYQKTYACHTNAHPTETLKLIHKQAYYVVINNTTIEMFIDSNRMLQWYIKISHKDDIKVDPNRLD